jgi:integrase
VTSVVEPRTKPWGVVVKSEFGVQYVKYCSPLAPYAKSSAARSFKPLLNKAGVPHTVRFHDLRHTCATILRSKNVNPKVVQEMLAWPSIS